MKVARYSFSGSIPVKFFLSIDYDTINKHLEKLPSQSYYIKMKICCDPGCNNIGVVIATKWCQYLLYLQQHFSLGTVLPKSFTEAFSSNSRLDVREVKTESVRALRRYFGIKFLSLEVRSFYHFSKSISLISVSVYQFFFVNLVVLDVTVFWVQSGAHQTLARKKQETCSCSDWCHWSQRKIKQCSQSKWPKRVFSFREVKVTFGR